VTRAPRDWPLVTTVRAASVADAGEILTVQRAAFVTEAQLNDRTDLPPLTETLSEVVAAVAEAALAGAASLVLVAELDGPRGRRLVGSGRVRWDQAAATAYVGRLAVAPDQHGTGIGSSLLAEAERLALESWPGLVAFELFTGATSERNIGWYQRMGYALDRPAADTAGIPVVIMRKPVG
jgi:GNAT superfamily N-acetyltransferase